ncbi:hypothetical protein D3C78_1772980 [compost metagenome]
MSKPKNPSYLRNRFSTVRSVPAATGEADRVPRLSWPDRSFISSRLRSSVALLGGTSARMFSA